MKNIEKKKTEPFREFIYCRVANTASYPLVYVAIVSLNLLIDFSLLSLATRPSHIPPITISHLAIMFTGVALLLAFVLVTLLSAWKDMFKGLWMYTLLLLEASGGIYVSTMSSCMQGQEWCTGKPEFQLTSVGMLVVYCLIIIVFRTHAYYPFNSIDNVFAMKQEYISISLLIYRLCIGTVQSLPLLGSFTSELKLTLLINCCLFLKSRHSGYLNPISRTIWEAYFVMISWSSLIMFVSNYSEALAEIGLELPGAGLSLMSTFWYLWSYTTPFIFLLLIYQYRSLGSGAWRHLFLASDHSLQKQVGKGKLFLVCNKFYLKLQEIKKCEMKYKDEEFKKLWILIETHNSKCTDVDCILKELDEIKRAADDDYLEQKRFAKTIQVCLEYGSAILEKVKQVYPNDFELNLEIGCYDLFALRNKQKGMKLVQEVANYDKERRQQENQRSNSGQKEGIIPMQEGQKKKSKSSKFKDLSSGDRYAVFFLKKQIDNIFIGQERLAQTNMDNQISEFRQKVEISVTMLAQFWSLLADPKCNLKKLYELTNILFPLKVSVEKDWQRIQMFKNIESYNFYAKYLIKMFNDKDKGLRILSQAKKIEYEQRNKEEIELNNKTVELVEQNGVIFLEFDGKNSGVIFQVNVNAEKIFGFSKGELLQRKVNDIMPGIYAEHHDRILEYYQETNQSTMMNKERHVWGKSKDGNIFQFTILIKPILNFYSQASTSEVYASIKREVYIKEVVGIVVDNNNIVRQVSSTAFNLFPILKKASAGGKRNPKNEISIQSLFPGYNEIQQKILQENETHEIQIERSVMEKHQRKPKYVEKCVFTMQISTVNIKIAGKIGLIIKLTKSSQSQYQKSGGPEDSLASNALPNSLGIQLVSVPVPNLTSSIMNHSQPKNSIMKDLQSIGSKGLKCNERKFMFSFNISDKKTYKSIRYLQKIQEERSEAGLVDSKDAAEQGDVKSEQKEEKEDKRPVKSLKKSPKQFERLKYLGGHFRRSCALNDFFGASVETFKNQLKRSEVEEQLQKVNYAQEIKTKRLVDNQIREMREQQENLNFGQTQEEGKEEQEQNETKMHTIKPSELSLILQKDGNNKLISYLKALTVTLVLLSCTGCIIEFVTGVKQEQRLLGELESVKQINEITSESLYLREYLAYLTRYPATQYFSLPLFQAEINQLDLYLDYFKFVHSTHLVYSDGSSDSYYLGFALSKLVSEGNTISQDPNTGLLASASDSSNTFFISYNMVNNMLETLWNERQDYKDKSAKRLKQLHDMYLIFLVVMGSVLSALMVVKNCLLKCVLNRKTEILEVFFEIPRRSCTNIQKECEKFIMRLSVQGEDDEMDMSDIEDQAEDNSSKKVNAQKKRQVIGEEKTTLAFILSTLAFMLILLFFHLFLFAQSLATRHEVKLAVDTACQFYELEPNFSTFSNFLTSSVGEPTFPLIGSNYHSQVLATMESSLEVLINVIKESYQQVKVLLDRQFSALSEKLLYRDICSASEGDCLGSVDVPQQKFGLNSLISQYMVQLQQDLGMLSSNASNIISEPSLTQRRLYQLALKAHWRQMTSAIKEGMDVQYRRKHRIELSILITVCAINLSLWLGLWWKYYQNVEQKIVATEYILTFIPLNEINKNPKIAAYIKEQILINK